MPNIEHFEVISTHHTLINKAETLQTFIKSIHKTIPLMLRREDGTLLRWETLLLWKIINVLEGSKLSVNCCWVPLIRSGQLWWRWWIHKEGTTCSEEALSISILLKLDKMKESSLVKMMFQVFCNHKYPTSRYCSVSPPEGDNDQNSDLASDTSTQRPRRWAAIIGEQIRWIIINRNFCSSFFIWLNMWTLRPFCVFLL